jgi:hypothetical protein
VLERFYPHSLQIVLEELEVWTDIKLWQWNLDQLHVHDDDDDGLQI